MTGTLTYGLSQTGDLTPIKGLLQRSGLPIADINEGEIDFVVAINDKNEVVGCIGLQRYTTDGFLRSFAVDPAHRNKGIGHELFGRLLSLSRRKGIKNLHLLTTTAEKFFASSGFKAVARDEAPGAIKATAEFSSLCPSSSAYMVMTVI